MTSRASAAPGTADPRGRQVAAAAGDLRMCGPTNRSRAGVDDDVEADLVLGPDEIVAAWA